MNLAWIAAPLAWLKGMLRFGQDAALVGKNAELEGRVREQERKLAYHESGMEYDPDDGVYYQVRESEPRRGPFCPACWTASLRKVPVQLISMESAWRCVAPEQHVTSRPSHRRPSLPEPRDMYDDLNFPSSRP